MNKLELVEALKKSNGLSKSESSKVVDLFFNEMSNTLAAGDRVEIRGFCSFFVKEYDSYTGRNPKTGETGQDCSKKATLLQTRKGIERKG